MITVLEHDGSFALFHGNVHTNGDALSKMNDRYPGSSTCVVEAFDSFKNVDKFVAMGCSSFDKFPSVIGRGHGDLDKRVIRPVGGMNYHIGSSMLMEAEIDGICYYAVMRAFIHDGYPEFVLSSLRKEFGKYLFRLYILSTAPHIDKCHLIKKNVSQWSLLSFKSF